MSDLGIENSITVHPKVPHESTRILAEVMENFDDASIFQNLLQAEWERIEFC